MCEEIWSLSDLSIGQSYLISLHRGFLKYFGNFSMGGEKYYFAQSEIQPE